VNLSTQSSSNSKDFTIYIWRLDSAKEVCHEFQVLLQSYLDQQSLGLLKKSFTLKEVKVLEEIKKDGILLMVEFKNFFSYSFPASTGVAKKKMVIQSGFAGKIFLVVLMYGKQASPTKLVDEKGQEVALDFPYLYICLRADDGGFFLNKVTENSLKEITNSIWIH